MKPLSVALVTKSPEEVPDWVFSAAKEAGIDLTVGLCGTRAQLLDRAGRADVIWTMGRNVAVTGGVLPDLPLCKAIMRSGSGLDDIPVEAAKKLGIRVAHTPEAIAGAVAEHTVALLLALVRQVARHDRAVKTGVWESEGSWAKWHVPGKTLGIIGFGLIARETVALLQGFRMTFLAFDPYADPEQIRAVGAEPAGLEELLQHSDFVSVHCPLTDETRHLLGPAEFRTMKERALLINTSRGGVLDERALVDALRSGRLGGAALDVLEQEPPPPEHPLLTMDNVLLTPHIAAFSDEFEANFWSASLEKLKQLKQEIQSGTLRKKP